MKSVTRRFAASIACWAMLFAALAPSISHAWSVSRGATWAEICGVGGAKTVNIGVDQGGMSDPATPGANHLEHCPFCATHAGSFALLPPTAWTIPVIDTQTIHPLLFFQSPRPLAIWMAAQSRGPPVAV